MAVIPPSENPPRSAGAATSSQGPASPSRVLVDTGAAPPLRSGPEGPPPPSSLRLLTTPLTEDIARSLTVGDTVEISGRLYTGRDAVHHRLHHGELPPVDLRGGIIYHCGPVMVQEGGRWVCKAAGPTTSTREEPYQWEVMRDHGIRGVIGKGGMGPKTLEGCQQYGCVYLHAIGGAAQVCAERITRVDGVDWMDLGSPEAIWHLWVERFPCIVTMDSRGGSLHRQVRVASEKALGALKA